MSQPYTYWEKQKQLKKMVQIFESVKKHYRTLPKKLYKNRVIK